MTKITLAQGGVDDFLDIPLLTRIANAVLKEDRKLLEELAKH